MMFSVSTELDSRLSVDAVNKKDTIVFVPCKKVKNTFFPLTWRQMIQWQARQCRKARERHLIRLAYLTTFCTHETLYSEQAGFYNPAEEAKQVDWLQVFCEKYHA